MDRNELATRIQEAIDAYWKSPHVVVDQLVDLDGLIAMHENAEFTFRKIEEILKEASK